MAEGPERREEEDRRAILTRRDRLIAAALVGLSTAAGCGDDSGEPRVCLAVPIQQSQDPSPHPCLSEMGDPVPPEVCLEPMPVDHGEAVESPAQDPQGPTGGQERVGGDMRPPAPRVCLRPRVCLTPARDLSPETDPLDGVE